MNTFILIIVLATSGARLADTSTVIVEFGNKENCESALLSLSKQAKIRGNYILAKGCFPK
jgi:hypothetical protein